MASKTQNLPSQYHMFMTVEARKWQKEMKEETKVEVVEVKPPAVSGGMAEYIKMRKEKEIQQHRQEKEIAQ